MDSLYRGWLALELQSVDREIENWGVGLRESFEARHSVALSHDADSSTVSNRLDEEHLAERSAA